jgi:hypothetical protein
VIVERAGTRISVSYEESGDQAAPMGAYRVESLLHDPVFPFCAYEKTPTEARDRVASIVRLTTAAVREGRGAPIAGGAARPAGSRGRIHPAPARRALELLAALQSVSETAARELERQMPEAYRVACARCGDRALTPAEETLVNGLAAAARSALAGRTGAEPMNAA